jgi:hypothetical protein
VTALGLDGHVVFIDRFVERPELLDHIAMCDVYVTPYLVESQMTSGTLAYSHGWAARWFPRPTGMRLNCWRMDRACLCLSQIPIVWGLRWPIC